MTPDETIRKARASEILPLYLLVGDDEYQTDQVVRALRAAAIENGPAAFNEEKLVAGEASVDRILSAAKMVPMMAKRRFILVTGLERWEARADDDAEDAVLPAAEAKGTAPLDRLAEYAAHAVPSTCLVLTARKLDGRRKLSALARKSGWLVSCDPLARNALPGWIVREAQARGHTIDHALADLLAELAGPELAFVADALERVGLYVGQGQPITEEAIAACVVKLRHSTVWELVSAVGRRDLGQALRLLEDVYDPRDRGLRLMGVLAWSVRQLIRFDAALRTGARPDEAALKAGAPPFKARELANQVRAMPRGELERWLLVLSRTDLELKGSRRQPRAIVEDTIMQLCH